MRALTDSKVETTKSGGRRPRCEPAVGADRRGGAASALPAPDPEARRPARTYYLATGPVREPIARLAFRIR
jgi:hypothetical protein